MQIIPCLSSFQHPYYLYSLFRFFDNLFFLLNLFFHLCDRILNLLNIQGFIYSALSFRRLINLKLTT